MSGLPTDADLVKAVEREYEINAQRFLLIRDAVIQRILFGAGVQSVEKLDIGKLDIADLIHTVVEDLDLSDPTVISGAASAVYAAAYGETLDIEHASPLAEMLGALGWSVACNMSDASVQWVLENYGEDAADKLYSALEFEAKELNDRLNKSRQMLIEQFYAVK